MSLREVQEGQAQSLKPKTIQPKEELKKDTGVVRRIFNRPQPTTPTTPSQTSTPVTLTQIEENVIASGSPQGGQLGKALVEQRVGGTISVQRDTTTPPAPRPPRGQTPPMTQKQQEDYYYKQRYAPMNEEFKKIDEAYKVNPALGFMSEMGYGAVTSVKAFGAGVYNLATGNKVYEPSMYDLAFEQQGANIWGRRPVFTAGSVFGETLQFYVGGKIIKYGAKGVTNVALKIPGVPALKNVVVEKNMDFFMRHGPSFTKTPGLITSIGAYEGLTIPQRITTGIKNTLPKILYETPASEYLYREGLTGIKPTENFGLPGGYKGTAYKYVSNEYEEQLMRRAPIEKEFFIQHARPYTIDLSKNVRNIGYRYVEYKPGELSIKFSKQLKPYGLEGEKGYHYTRYEPEIRFNKNLKPYGIAGDDTGYRYTRHTPDIRFDKKIQSYGFKEEKIGYRYANQITTNKMTFKKNILRLENLSPTNEGQISIMRTAPSQKIRDLAKKEMIRSDNLPDTSYMFKRTSLKELDEMERGIGTSSYWKMWDATDFIPKTGFKPMSLSGVINIGAQTELNINKQLNKQNTLSLTKQGLRSDSIQKVLQESATRQEDKTLQRTEQRTDVISRQMFRPSLKTKTDITPRFEYSFDFKIDEQRAPKIIIPPWLPDFGSIRPSSKPEKSGYDVYVKERRYVRGKKRYPESWKKANTSPLSEDAALSLGGTAIDQSAAASFKIRPSEGNARPLKIPVDPWGSISSKFYKKGNIYIENTGSRIDTTGEIKGISALGWIASRQREFKPIQISRQPITTRTLVMPSFTPMDIDKLMRGWKL